ncbi:SDR family oxidoreductase [Azospirillum sp. YIM B02556]|uniref:SDR family oxidoreductase n=1 Tax=Azospirillum endophyticum TaxID=2800326 RepID=A0ABS1FEQ1_9PROT|nr:SDR family oxidoreductase [Azospirillum endophyticum]MBK1841918.1 SDR family oxidoreductase [Azospirillum endophyticum]
MTTSNRIAIVTGGSRSLGRSTVLTLAERGVRSIFTYHSRPEEAGTVVALTREAGAEAVALALDTGDAGSFDGFAGRVGDALAQFGAERFEYLVNNAGISDHTPFAALTEDVLDRIYAVNLKGVLLLTQRLLPLMTDGGRIINISTGLTRFTTPDTIAYASLKGAIEVFTLHLAKELGPRGITVNTVAPGAIQTDFSGGIVRDNPEVNRRVAAMTALGRPGLPDDVGLIVSSLLSEDSRWVTGQRIEVSGGMNL